MVKLAEAILKKKNEFGPLSAEFMKNARATSRDKATTLSMESIVSTSSNGKRKSIDEDVPKEELPAKKKGKKTAIVSKEAEPVEKKTRKKKAEKKVEEEKSQDERETTPKAKSSKKKAEIVAAAPTTAKRVMRTRSASIAEHLSKATISEPQPKSISSTTKALPKRAASKKSKKPSPSPEPTDEEDQDEKEDEGEGEGEETEKEGEFFGFSTDDDGDSSDDDDLNEAPALDVTKLPTIAKDDATVKRKLDQAKKKPAADKGVIYLGRVPHGFYEDQMKSYFTQFGDVTRLRLSRNKRTGRSKHYAFIEFDSSSVAKIVAETMDNYLLMGHILTCKVIPKDEVHPELWIGANRKWRAVPATRAARVKHNKPRTEEEQQKVESRLVKRQSEKKRKLAEAGIDYDFDAVSYKRKPRNSKA
ncbi:hypothetical protein QCA50_005743 [Cerrena zonata]|uniref:RRM domain-containing protein n=1 Tax=Cerrena zonata TaxID=2478898 RepID=A0AAW0GG07_9APHY